VTETVTENRGSNLAPFDAEHWLFVVGVGLRPLVAMRTHAKKTDRDKWNELAGLTADITDAQFNVAEKTFRLPLSAYGEGSDFKKELVVFGAESMLTHSKSHKRHYGISQIAVKTELSALIIVGGGLQRRIGLTAELATKNQYELRYIVWCGGAT
jgi:hypothetical protein